MGEMMKVSLREEDLAKELYEQDLNLHQAEDTPWDKQIEKVRNSYRRQASRIVNTKWFRRQVEEALITGAYREAVARDEANTDNRLP